MLHRRLHVEEVKASWVEEYLPQFVAPVMPPMTQRRIQSEETLRRAIRAEPEANSRRHGQHLPSSVLQRMLAQYRRPRCHRLRSPPPPAAALLPHRGGGGVGLLWGTRLARGGGRGEERVTGVLLYLLGPGSDKVTHDPTMAATFTPVVAKETNALTCGTHSLVGTTHAWNRLQTGGRHLVSDGDEKLIHGPQASADCVRAVEKLGRGGWAVSGRREWADQG
jgi:hypothetical protein